MTKTKGAFTNDMSLLKLVCLATKNIERKWTAPSGKFGFSILNLYGRENLLGRNYGLVSIVDDENNQSIGLRKINRFSLRTTPNIFFRVSF
ncbi:MAG: hypothetical protein CR994_05170 [Maribacter sp.]|nr:MAG: hypothetical protein CR994_05170 [Maribacter sp.]